MLTNWIQLGGTIGSGQHQRFDGVYPQMFYRSALYPQQSAPADMFQHDAGSARWDALVVDVHTDLPCPDCGDPGSVLHEAVGNVDLLIIAVDNGPDRMVYAGPVLSHYEFELIGPPSASLTPTGETMDAKTAGHLRLLGRGTTWCQGDPGSRGPETLDHGRNA